NRAADGLSDMARPISGDPDPRLRCRSGEDHPTLRQHSPSSKPVANARRTRECRLFRGEVVSRSRIGSTSFGSGYRRSDATEAMDARGVIRYTGAVAPTRRDVRDEPGSPLALAARSTGVPMTRTTPDEVRARYAALQPRLRALFQRLKDDAG